MFDESFGTMREAIDHAINTVGLEETVRALEEIIREGQGTQSMNHFGMVAVCARELRRIKRDAPHASA